MTRVLLLSLSLWTAVFLTTTVAESKYAWSVPAGFPLPPVPTDNPMTEAKVELGREGEPSGGDRTKASATTIRTRTPPFVVSR